MSREKQKQFMLILMISLLSSMLFLGTGCGQKSCETPKVGCESTDNADGLGISIPGCGGCLSSGSGWGCDTCGAWSQSIKIVAGTASREYIVTEDKKDSKNKAHDDNSDKKVKTETDTAFVVGVDDQYYVNEGCGGCQNNKLHATYGVVACDSPATWLVSVGNHPKGELYVGCGSGCASIGACGTKKPGRETLNALEHVLDVK